MCRPPNPSTPSCPIERERKKRNLVIVALPENDKSRIRCPADKEFVQGVCSSLTLPEDALEDVFRDGQVRSDLNGRPYQRIIKVRFATVDSRGKFLRGFKSICTSRGVYCRPDLTYHQRQADKLLKAELYRRREAEQNQNLIIVKGKIVERRAQGVTTSSNTTQSG